MRGADYSTLSSGSSITFDRRSRTPTPNERWLLHASSYISLLLTSPKPSIVVLVGPPKSGKTSLAKAALRRYQELNPSDRCIYLSCRSLRSENETISKILSEFDNKASAVKGLSSRELLTIVFDLIRSMDNRLLLLFDDIDSLTLRGYTFLVDLLPKLHEVEVIVGNKIGVLLTSRAEELITDRLPLGSYYLVKLNSFNGSRVIEGYDDFNEDLKNGLGKGDSNYTHALHFQPINFESTETKPSIHSIYVPDVLISSEGNSNSFVSEMKLSRNHMAVLKAISQAKALRDGFKKMGDVERTYTALCLNEGESPIGHTRLWEITRELEAISLVERRVVSLGRGGRTTLVRLSCDVYRP